MNGLGCRISGETLSKLHSLVDDYSIDEALKYLPSPHFKQFRVNAVQTDGDALRSVCIQAIMRTDLSRG